MNNIREVLSATQEELFDLLGAQSEGFSEEVAEEVVAE